MNAKEFSIRFYLLIAGSLLLLSAFLYLLHYAIFSDSHHIFIYLLGDFAFLPIEVLFVTLIIDRVLEQREKRSRMEKLNMVIGTFFSEVGSELLAHLSSFDLNCNDIRECLILGPEWKLEEFDLASQTVAEHDCMIGQSDDELDDLRGFLLSRRPFLITMLENSSLLEHETFTDLLWAVFHLTEELKYRTMLEQLPEMDHQHICSDIARAYGLLVREWLAYMRHLKSEYPYLYSLAMRTNPFNPKSSPVIED
ncbi:MAG: hypothetical protein A2W01_04310 [Candidatus Solincola sediminis]|nr:MAG: hypothetical protein A2W01_04310 [Candidatus Solincola sediminis]